MTATRERAINLRDWEVRAIQAGRLKMLVRPVKPQPNNPEVFGVSPIWGSCVPTEDTPGVRSGSIPAECIGRYSIHAATNENGRRVDRWIACPYGQPGDRLRGREAWRAKSWSEDGWGEIEYRADGRVATVEGPWSFTKMYPFDMLPHVWRSSVYMPRFAVRNWLEITEVRCGRARDMSHRDMLFAGWPDHDKLCGGEPTGTHWDYVTKGDWINAIGDGDDGCVEWFADQYDADHGEGAWERDWVWMIGVKRIEGGV